MLPAVSAALAERSPEGHWDASERSMQSTLRPRSLYVMSPSAARFVDALDRESAEWLRGLQTDGPEREQTIERLHALLLRVTRSEAARRRPTLPGRALDEVDDLCVQAAR